MRETLESAATRPSLLLRIRDPRDVGAWEAFVSLYGSMVAEYCRRRGIQPADAAEITQEVMLQVSRSIGSFTYEPHRGKFRSWLASVVRSKLIALVRSNQRYSAKIKMFQEHESTERAVDAQWTDVWQSQLMATALREVEQRLSCETFSAFKLTWMDGLAAVDVSQRLGQPVSWVYVAKSRSLKLLRSVLTELADEPLGE